MSKDINLVAIQNKAMGASQIALRAEALQIVDDTTAVQASEFSTQIHKAIKSINELEKKALMPHKEKIKAAQLWVKSLRLPLEQAKASLNNRLLGYQEKVIAEAKKSKVEESAVDTLAEENEDGSLTFNENLEDVKKEQVKPNLVGSRKDWFCNYEQSELAKVPLEYLTFDKQKINKAIKGGVRSIDGLKIESKTVPVAKRG